MFVTFFFLSFFGNKVQSCMAKRSHVAVYVHRSRTRVLTALEVGFFLFPKKTGSPLIGSRYAIFHPEKHTRNVSKDLPYEWYISLLCQEAETNDRGSPSIDKREEGFLERKVGLSTHVTETRFEPVFLEHQLRIGSMEMSKQLLNGRRMERSYSDIPSLRIVRNVEKLNSDWRKVRFPIGCNVVI